MSGADTATAPDAPKTSAPGQAARTPRGGQSSGGVLLVAGRELGAYFDSAIAYVFTIAFVLLANSIFMNEFFLTGTVEMTVFFDRLPLLLAISLPAISMRLWAEERKQRTIEVLRGGRDHTSRPFLYFSFPTARSLRLRCDLLPQGAQVPTGWQPWARLSCLLREARFLRR